jgi:hypothetical protein
MDNPENARRQAEALFKRKEKSLLDNAMEEYHADLLAMREKMTRLRALRLARDQAKGTAGSDPGDMVRS